MIPILKVGFDVIRLKRRSTVFLVCWVLMAAVLWMAFVICDYVVGFPRLVEGRIVRRYTSWYGLYYGLPIPAGHSTVYYYYVDAQGREVKHGLFQNMHSNGTVQTRGYYSHGTRKGTWTDWDMTGKKTSEWTYQAGELIGGWSTGPHEVKGIAPGKPVHDP
jgi:hypothetical protein